MELFFLLSFIVLLFAFDNSNKVGSKDIFNVGLRSKHSFLLRSASDSKRTMNRP